MSDTYEVIPDDSEQLDQLQPDESLIDRGVADVLDEGYTAPDRWSSAERYGSTAAERFRGETLDQRLAEEEPDITDLADWEDDGENEEVGGRRAGRLVDSLGGYDGEDTESEALGRDVGIDGGAASAEEAAMHIIGE
ncbi:MAG: DUF5709 domain-containing protein [Propionibacteriaceae bacterium]|jgi:hypothetical protein|nr:DUF5709 domain-containing protein [Propionibacteriaceae bacterium]